MDSRIDIMDALEKDLFGGLRSLGDAMNFFTKERYNRINPMNENLIDWKERGKLVSGHGNNTVYESCTVIGDIKMGDYCWIGPYTILDGGGGLTIGTGVTIAANAMVYTHDTLRFTLSEGKMPYEYAPVTIEDYCFIGSQSIILKGSHIGNHSLVAANSLVSFNVPPYKIVAGSPAKIIGEIYVENDGSVRMEYLSVEKGKKTIAL